MSECAQYYQRSLSISYLAGTRFLGSAGRRIDFYHFYHFYRFSRLSLIVFLDAIGRLELPGIVAIRGIR